MSVCAYPALLKRMLDHRRGRGVFVSTNPRSSTERDGPLLLLKAAQLYVALGASQQTKAPNIERVNRFCRPDLVEMGGRSVSQLAPGWERPALSLRRGPVHRTPAGVAAQRYRRREEVAT